LIVNHIKKYDIIVIGGGFYGAYLSEYFAKSGKTVLLCEKEKALMQRASHKNQARVHNGYHYPLSILTALRSMVSFPRFCEEFRECINDSFENYYMVGKILSKLSSSQFKCFCERIGIPCDKTTSELAQLTNPQLVEDVFRTVEYTFDAIKLKDTMVERLMNSGVDILLNTDVESVSLGDKSNLAVELNMDNDNQLKFAADQVYNCTYSMLNSVTSKSKLELIPLKHEMTEMCLVNVPDAIKEIGITLMCGPFFSIMPFPSTDYHTFSHVRYTPHYEWYDKQGEPFVNNYERRKLFNRHSAWKKMQKDASRYMPVLSECEYVSSLWEVKTILPVSEASDSRPILFKQDHGLKGFHCVIGGKIDNVYDVIDIISSRELN